MEAECTLVRLEQRLSGRLKLAKHHMVFRSDGREIWICYPIVQELSRPQAAPHALRVLCKDFMFVRFEFLSIDECLRVLSHLEELVQVTSIRQLYAFVYSPAPPESAQNGWQIGRDIVAEYTRMGIDWSAWRVSEANTSYGLCPTYPKNLVVPSEMSDNVLAHAARFRSKGRLPVLSWYHSLNKCTISRCAQPLVGVRQQRNMQDEKLVHAIFGTTDAPSGTWGASCDNLIVDLRPSTNALAQTALGGGTENMDRYRLARKIYLGIDNLHVMRDSIKSVVDALRHSDTSPAPPSPAALERSNWLHHLRLILEGTTQIVQQVHAKCSHVVVHCSDGWDRTPQLTSLAMLLLDPHYRTLEGFMLLIEKEWLAYGHQFLTRNGAVSKRTVQDTEDSLLSNMTSFITDQTRNRQTGPIFHQWLDCVYQLVWSYPDRFEFNERMLRRLLYHSYACQYGTFLFNSERERYDARAHLNTRSVWDYFLARREQFVSPSYKKFEDVFLPPGEVRWWAAAFGRADRDMNDPEAWKQYAMRPLAGAGSRDSSPAGATATATGANGTHPSHSANGTLSTSAATDKTLDTIEPLPLEPRAPEKPSLDPPGSPHGSPSLDPSSSPPNDPPKSPQLSASVALEEVSC